MEDAFCRLWNSTETATGLDQFTLSWIGMVALSFWLIVAVFFTLRALRRKT